MSVCDDMLEILWFNFKITSKYIFKFLKMHRNWIETICFCQCIFSHCNKTHFKTSNFKRKVSHLQTTGNSMIRNINILFHLYFFHDKQNKLVTPGYQK